MTKKLWSGRFNKATASEVDAFNASITFDQQLALDDIQGSLAHAQMLAHCNIISQKEYDKIKAGLLEIAQDYTDGKLDFAISDEDIHMNIERHLTDKIGDAAKKLHTARSRNDQVALDVHLYVRRQILATLDLITQLQATLLDLAQAHTTTILPGYTHLQRAQPIYLAQQFLAYIAMLERDSQRLQNNWQHANQSPLGACALAGTSLPTDRHYVAALLGFDGIYHNTLDAVSDRDFVLEFLSNASLIMMHLSRFSEELILWSSQEFNFITFDDAYCTGSSIMPQKKNPDVAELARGKTGRVYGALFSLLTTLKGLPLAYNKDMQEDKEPLFDTVKTLQTTLSIYKPLLATLKVNKENMRKAVDLGHLNATALAEYLVKAGIPFRNAHEIVGKLVAHCLNKSCRLDDLSLEELKQFSPEIHDDVFAALNIEIIVKAHDLGNSKHESALVQELQIAQDKIGARQAWLQEKLTVIQPLGF